LEEVSTIVKKKTNQPNKQTKTQSNILETSLHPQAHLHPSHLLAKRPTDGKIK
jgi:hypothetical protein